MSNTLYHSNSQRFIPEFMGVATRYNQQKQLRTQAEKQRMQQRVDSQLQKRYTTKTQQLQRLRESRQIRLDESRQKRQWQASRQQHVEKLKQKNRVSRMSSRKKLEDVRHSLIVDKKQNYQTIKTKLGSLSEQFKKILSDKMKDKARRCQSIRQQEAQSQKAVNEFHRKKNAECVLAYLERIRMERLLKKENDRKAKVLQKNISKMDKNIQIKSSYVSELQMEVYRHRLGNQGQRQKSNTQQIKRGNKGITLEDKKLEIDLQQSHNPQNSSTE